MQRNISRMDEMIVMTVTVGSGQGVGAVAAWTHLVEQTVTHGRKHHEPTHVAERAETWGGGGVIGRGGHDDDGGGGVGWSRGLPFWYFCSVVKSGESTCKGRGTCRALTCSSCTRSGDKCGGLPVSASA